MQQSYEQLYFNLSANCSFLSQAAVQARRGMLGDLATVETPYRTESVGFGAYTLPLSLVLEKAKIFLIKPKQEEGVPYKKADFQVLETAQRERSLRAYLRAAVHAFEMY